MRVRLALLAAAALSLGAAAPAPNHWSPAWTASMLEGTGEKNQIQVDNATVSFAVRVGMTGSKLRLKLSNDYGPAFRIGAASVRLTNGKSIPVTFDGKPGTIMPAFAPLTSDAVALPVKAFDIVEVSIFLPEKVALNTIHSAPGAPTQISGPGDHTAQPFEAVAHSGNRPLLAGVDVLGDRQAPVIVAFGDSITDNTGCANDGMPICRWSDVLGRRLAKAGDPHVVVTQAISGNRILSMGTGPSALTRFDRDVLSLPGVTHIVLLEGINDIGGSGRMTNNGADPTITAEQLIQGYRQLVSRAHAHGIKVIGLTVLPFKGAGYQRPEGEEMREKVNAWMRSSGTFDGVFDMEKVVADPADPKRLETSLQRGDNLHPNPAGETKMGEALPLTLFR
jgi:lysophospholipase L1-like esterase